MITEKELNSQKNPTTTAVGVKMGGTSRVSPQVLPEKVLNPSSGTSQEVTQDKTIKLYLNEIGDMTIKADMSNNARHTIGYIIKQIVKLEKSEAISNFAEKIKTWAWRYQKCIGEGTYSSPVTLQYTDTKDLLKEIDKLVEEQTLGDLAKEQETTE